MANRACGVHYAFGLSIHREGFLVHVELCLARPGVLLLGTTTTAIVR